MEKQVQRGRRAAFPIQCSTPGNGIERGAFGCAVRETTGFYRALKTWEKWPILFGKVGSLLIHITLEFTIGTILDRTRGWNFNYLFYSDSALSDAQHSGV